MKIKTSALYETERNETVAEYTERKLDGNDYGYGQVEAAAKSAEKASAAIGRLLEFMADNGILKAPDVTKIVEGYRRNDASFSAERKK
jgi:hypothetical protein